MPCSLWYFPSVVSHVVGEVTYVELFKDAEGKSRVSVGDSALRQVPLRRHAHVTRGPAVRRCTFDLGVVCWLMQYNVYLDVR